jgi:GNAT superfamily N-acetyltransferase
VPQVFLIADVNNDRLCQLDKWRILAASRIQETAMIENRMRWPVRELTVDDRPALERHLLALEADDRRLRFGITTSDAGIRGYVARLEFDRDAVLGVFGESLQLLGAAHVARAAGHAELGVSVLAGHRNAGIGGALLGRAVLRARNWGVQALFMHCLNENAAMMHLARKQDMRITRDAGEADAWLELPRPDAATFFGEALEQRVGWFDFALKVFAHEFARAALAARARMMHPTPEAVMRASSA